MKFKIQEAESHHRDAVLKLLPRLADFPIPNKRKPEEFWQGDAVLVKQHFDEKKGTPGSGLQSMKQIIFWEPFCSDSIRIP